MLMSCIAMSMTMHHQGKKLFPKKLTHAEFVEHLAEELIWPENREQLLRATMPSSASISSTDFLSVASPPDARPKKRKYTARISGVVDAQTYLDGTRCTIMNKTSLDSKFPHRFDGSFHPFIAVNRKPCQMCMYEAKQADPSLGKPTGKVRRTGNGTYREKTLIPKNCKLVQRCIKCNVNLCNECFHTFHGVNLTLRLTV